MRIGMRHIYIFFLSFGLILGLCLKGEAALALSASPVKGGNSLRFGRLDSSKEETQEVRIRVTSDEGRQYQLYQTMIEPLVNEKGQSLLPSALRTYAITGSNSSGTLYLQQMGAMKYADDLIYTSSATGQSDSLTMVYALDTSLVRASGRFSGKILYTLRSVSGAAQQQAYIDVFLEVSEEFKVTTQASAGKDTVKLDTRSPAGAQGYFKISFSGNVGQEVKVYQEVDRFSINEMNREIGKDVVSFSVSGSEDTQVNANYANPLALERRLEIYSSSKAEDEFTIQFVLNDEAAARQKAGLYRGQLKYVFERAGSRQAVFLNLEIEISPIFEMVVTFPQGEPRFDKLLPGSPPQVREADLEIKTNLEKPYMVTQKISSPLASQKGFVFDRRFFDMKVEVLEGDGKSDFSDFKTVPLTGEAFLRSGTKGEPLRAKVLYRLTPYPEMEPGDYMTSIVYSLGET